MADFSDYQVVIWVSNGMRQDLEYLSMITEGRWFQPIIVRGKKENL